MRSLVPWRSRGGSLSPWEHHPLDQLRREFDALFDRLSGGLLAPHEEDWPTQRFWGIDVQEDDKEFIVRAEVPGFEEKELDLQVCGDVLTIKAEKEHKGEGEHQYRRFHRSFTLPAGTDPDKVQANYRNGVLELHVPRSEKVKPRRIALQGQPGEQAGTRTGKDAAPRPKA